MQYRRARTEGGTYFFTAVTHKRRKILCDESAIALLRAAFRTVMARHAFSIDAIVVLPDHLHTVWTLPDGDVDYSCRWRLVKSYFSRECKAEGEALPNPSRQKKNEKAVWQRRFWEHLVRDEGDFKAHCDYVHYNPVKHGLVRAPKDWKYTSFHRCVRDGLHDVNWGAGEELAFLDTVGHE